MASRRDALRETMVGGHVQFDPLIGTHFGVTAYESKYDRYFSIADYADLGEFLIYDSYYYKKLDINDSEISRESMQNSKLMGSHFLLAMIRAHWS